MPALTHGRVENGFNGYATRVKLPNGAGLSNTQPIRYNGGQQPKRNFKAKYNAQVNAPNALPNSIGSSFTTKRANARRAGDPNRKLLGLPEVSRSAPGQASKKRKVPLSVGRPPNLVSGQLLSTITVGTFPLSPVFVGIDLGNYGGAGDWGSIVPPDTSGVYGLVLQDLGGGISEFIVTVITGFPSAALNYQVNIKITNVTKSESQVYQMTVAASQTPPAAFINTFTTSTAWNGTFWTAGDIVTVENLN